MTTKDDFYEYVGYFHDFTLNADAEYENIEIYHDRKVHFMADVQERIVELRISFLDRLSRDPKFYDLYYEYMDREQDYILFMNLNMTAVDQKNYSKDWYNEFIAPTKGKYEGNQPPPIRFIAYWHQVILWELYKAGITIVYWKSRDMGASFAIMGGFALSLLHKGGQEFLITSRVEPDIDIVGDLTQTLMGKLRNLIDETVLYSREDFWDDKFLSLKESKYSSVTGVKGFDPGKGGRGGKGLKDEAPADARLGRVVSSITEATSGMLYMGTLQNGTDTYFRFMVERSYRISNRDLLELQNGIEKRLRNRESYSLVMSEEISRFKEEKLEVGKTVAFTHNFNHHPLKKNCKNYDLFMRNKLYNDPIKIAEEHMGLLNFGNPKRSFWGIEDHHYQENLIEKFDLSSAEVLAGFDPGGDGKAYLAPFVLHDGRYYMLPVEQMIKVDMKVWAQQMRNKYPTMKIMGETSMNALKGVGEGWFHIWNKVGVETYTVTNRQPQLQLTCFNWMSIQKKMNYSNYEQENVLVIDEENKWFMANYIQGAKYGKDIKQKEYSHPADAVIALIYSQFKELFESAGSGYAAY